VFLSKLSLSQICLEEKITRKNRLVVAVGVRNMPRYKHVGTFGALEEDSCNRKI